MSSYLESLPSITGNLGDSVVIFNEYVLTASKIEGGTRLTVTRDSEVQVIDIMNGYTPVKGVDYWSEEDKAEMTEAAKSAAWGTIEDTVALVIGDVASITNEIDFLHPLSITKFTVAPSMAEKGSTIDRETFVYGVNRLNVSLSLEGEAVTGQSAARTDSLTADKTYTLSASLGSARANATATISFVAPVYYGVSASYEMTNETVLVLTRVLTKSRARTISGNAGTGKYILYALPAALGTPVFKVGGFEGGFTLVGAFDFTNASGHTECYNLYRSVNAGLGNTTVTIS